METETEEEREAEPRTLKARPTTTLLTDVSLEEVKPLVELTQPAEAAEPSAPMKRPSAEIPRPSVDSQRGETSSKSGKDVQYTRQDIFDLGLLFLFYRLCFPRVTTASFNLRNPEVH